MAYSGSIDLISGLRPKNNGSFPLVNAKDVYVNDGTVLSDLLASILDRLDNLENMGVASSSGVLAVYNANAESLALTSLGNATVSTENDSLRIAGAGNIIVSGDTIVIGVE